MVIRVEVQTTPEIFRESWKLQFQIMNRRRRKRITTGLVITVALLVPYLIFLKQIPETYFIFVTGLVALVSLRELVGVGAFLFDRAHHYGWIRENIEEETARKNWISYDETGFALYYEEYDTTYRWAWFSGYFEEGRYFWILNQKFEMVMVLCEEEIPEHWTTFTELVKSNVEEIEGSKMKP